MPLYKIFSVIFAWLVFPKTRRNTFRMWCEAKDLEDKINKINENYKNILKNIKKSGKRIKVIFLINDNSKWKTQTLYDKMSDDNMFEPSIVIGLAEKQRNLPLSEKKKIIYDNLDFFNKKGIKCKIGWNLTEDKAIPLTEFSPDMVFYQQPWGIPKGHKIQDVSKYALTCYVPYYVPNYGIMSMDCRTFHKYLFKYYVLNNDWEKLYKAYLGEKFGRNIFAAGHTMLDIYNTDSNDQSDKKYVIYAPHWSIKHIKNSSMTNYSTFDKYGQYILEFAKKHPEINWVFKPHPKLRSSLEQIGEMTREEIDRYYKEWDNIGLTCYDGDYTEIFKNSKALITDCASFLVEYFYTTKPLIHLISEYIDMDIPAPTKKILDTYYKVYNQEDLEKYLQEIILYNQDVLYSKRRELINATKTNTNSAANNIIEDLKRTINNA